MFLRPVTNNHFLDHLQKLTLQVFLDRRVIPWDWTYHIIKYLRLQYKVLPKTLHTFQWNSLFFFYGFLPSVHLLFVSSQMFWWCVLLMFTLTNYILKHKNDIWVRLSYATTHHDPSWPTIIHHHPPPAKVYPPPPTTSQNTSTTTYHFPQSGPPPRKNQSIFICNLLLALL